MCDGEMKLIDGDHDHKHGMELVNIGGAQGQIFSFFRGNIKGSPVLASGPLSILGKGSNINTQ